MVKSPLSIPFQSLWFGQGESLIVPLGRYLISPGHWLISYFNKGLSLDKEATVFTLFCFHCISFLSFFIYPWRDGVFFTYHNEVHFPFLNTLNQETTNKLIFKIRLIMAQVVWRCSRLVQMEQEVWKVDECQQTSGLPARSWCSEEVNLLLGQDCVSMQSGQQGRWGASVRARWWRPEPLEWAPTPPWRFWFSLWGGVRGVHL